MNVLYAFGATESAGHPKQKIQIMKISSPFLVILVFRNQRVEKFNSSIMQENIRRNHNKPNYSRTRRKTRARSIEERTSHMSYIFKKASRKSMAQTTEQSKFIKKRNHESLNFIKTIHLKHNVRINDFTQSSQRQENKNKKKRLSRVVKHEYIMT